MNNSTSEQNIGMAVGTDSQRDTTHICGSLSHGNELSLALEDYFDFLREEAPSENPVV